MVNSSVAPLAVWSMAWQSGRQAGATPRRAQQALWSRPATAHRNTDPSAGRQPGWRAREGSGVRAQSGRQAWVSPASRQHSTVSLLGSRLTSWAKSCWRLTAGLGVRKTSLAVGGPAPCWFTASTRTSYVVLVSSDSSINGL